MALLVAGGFACTVAPDDTPIIAGNAGVPANTSGSGGSTASAGTNMAMAGTTTTTAGTATGGSGGGSAGTATTAGSNSGGTASAGAAGASGGTTAGGSAGSGGGGSTDCSTFKLCDDFEGGALGMGTSPWKTQSGGGYTLELATDQAHSGTHSVHITAPTGTGSAHIVETKTFPATDAWYRAFLRFKAPPGGHQMFIMLSAPGDQIRILNTLGSAKVQQNLQSTDVFKTSATTIPMETWFCYEWHANASGVHVYMDGKEMTDAAATWSAAAATSLTIGYQRFQAGTAAGEIWIDDVAVNTTQVGCK